jgi:hypothetical protein
VTSNLVIELCRHLKRPCKVLFGSSCIVEFYPEGWDELDARRQEPPAEDPRLEHPRGARLLLRPRLLPAAQGEANQRAAPHQAPPAPAGHGRPSGLQGHGLVHPEAFDKAFEEKTPTVFKTTDIEAAEELLEKRRVGYKLGFRDEDEIGILHVPCGEQEKRAKYSKARQGIQIRRVSADWKKLCKIVDRYNVSRKERADAKETVRDGAAQANPTWDTIERQQYDEHRPQAPQGPEGRLRRLPTRMLPETHSIPPQCD